MDMKDVIISIYGSQTDSGGEDSAIELVTDGLFKCENGIYSFSYMESELTGLEGTQTSFKICPKGVIMLREGSLNTRMVFEEGKKHNFIYDTPYGVTTMGVNTKRVRVDLTDRGGDMEIDYLVDFQHSVVGHNMIKINVREQKGDVQ